MFLKKISIAFCFSLFFVCPVSAFDIPIPDGFVTDQANIFSEAEEASLEAKVQLIEDKTTAEVGILTVPTTEGEDIASLAFEVGNTWGVGKKENDNGLVILIAVDDRAWFMAAGYGLEGALPDAITKRIAENQFPTYFREGQYAEGVLAALGDIEGYLKNDPSVVAQYQAETYEESQSRTVKEVVIFELLLFLSFIKLVWIAPQKKRKGRIVASLITNAIMLAIGLMFTSALFVAIVMAVSILVDLLIIFGNFEGGGGSSGSSWSSSSDSSSSSSSNSSSWGSSSGSSSGGSFGGGSFGGGGSGGRW